MRLRVVNTGGVAKRVVIARISDIYAWLYNAVLSILCCEVMWTIYCSEGRFKLEIKRTCTTNEPVCIRPIVTYQAGCRFLRYLNYFRCFRCYFRCYRAEISKRSDFNFFDTRKAAQSICTCIIFRADCNSLPKAARYILLSISFSNISFF